MIESIKSDIVKVVEDILKNKNHKYNLNVLLDIGKKLEYSKNEGIDITELIEEIIISRKSFDLSEKLFLFNELCCYEEPLIKKQIFLDIMSRFANDCEIYNLKYPITTFLFYKEYRDSDGTFDKFFNSFLELDDDSFYEIMTEKLCTVCIAYTKREKYISIYNLAYTESFKKDLQNRINQLDDNKRDHVKMLIKTAGKY